jgi:two-component system, OmpR family, sensor histidine kinase MtrB
MTRERDGEDDVTRRFSVVAHELLNPLAVAQGYANLLRAETAEGDETVRQFAERIAHNVELATLLVQRLRDSAVSLTELQLDRRPVDVRPIVRGTVDDLAATVAASHPVEVVVPDEPVVVDADETRLRQILFNLVVNGAKYSHAEAPIHVGVSGGDRATIEVRNHGFGVAPDDAERLFERGARGHDTQGRPGLGVGLHLSRLIAEAHGGNLRVEPADVQGSRFILELPVASG